jgi:AraC-like DNA-binding protein
LLPTIFAILWSLTDWAGYTGALDTGVIRTSAVHGLCSCLLLALYCRATFRRLHEYRRHLLDTHSAIERISLNWLRLLTGIILFVGVAAAVVNTVILISGSLLSPIYLVVMPLTIVLFYAVAIFGFRQSSILLIGSRAAPANRSVDTAPAPHADEEQPTAAAAKYARSGLDAEELQRIWLRLEQLMREQTLYRDPDLPLAALAEQLGVASHTLSQVFNSHAGVRFYDYINGLRVNYAKHQLLDPRHRHTTILEIALDAGFNTKSTFNKCFKQVVGLPPSAYRNKHKPDRPDSRTASALPAD